MPSLTEIGLTVSAAKDRLATCDWLTAVYRSYSRHENRIYGIFSLHRPGDIKWYRTVNMTDPERGSEAVSFEVTGHYIEHGESRYSSEDGITWVSSSNIEVGFGSLDAALTALSRMPEEAYESAWMNESYRYMFPCLALGYVDHELASMPTEAHGVMSPGIIYGHTFYFNLDDGTLYSYWVRGVPFFLDEHGNPEPFFESYAFLIIYSHCYTHPFMLFNSCFTEEVTQELSTG